MAFATFALMMTGLIVGFLPGVAVGWHARPKVTVVHVLSGEARMQAGDNEIVSYYACGRMGFEDWAAVSNGGTTDRGVTR